MNASALLRLRAILSPVAKQRFRWERAKYRGAAILSPQAGNDFLADSVAAGKPFAAGKIGAAELGGLMKHERHADATGHCGSWGRHADMLYRNAGVYPKDAATFSKFCRIYTEALKDLDALAVWYRFGERSMQLRHAPRASLLAVTSLESYYHERPWTRMLAGKRVLVVTPFADTVLSQGRRLGVVWRTKPDVWPEVELSTLRVPLSAGLVAPLYPNWFDALDAMTEEMSTRAFDVVMIGAGAWSLPLAARAKQMGRWAIHLGGSTQVFFGIKGRRWDDNPLVVAAQNDAWVRPGQSERPATFEAVEQGCYW